jgi:Right handed beta helix region
MRISRNKIEENMRNGLLLKAKAKDQLISDNHFEENSEEAIRISNTNNAKFTLLNNRIKHKGAYAAVAATLKGSQTDIIINNNEVTGTAKGFDLHFNSEEEVSTFSLDFNNNTINSGTNPGLLVNQYGPKSNSLVSSGSGNVLDGSISFATNNPHHSTCLFKWTNNRASTFIFDNLATGLFNVNAPTASLNGFVEDNNNTPAITNGTVNFQPVDTPCAKSIASQRSN